MNKKQSADEASFQISTSYLANSIPASSKSEMALASN